ncbi:MAG: PepSY domain-containing protein [Pseudomonadales bacterium]
MKKITLLTCLLSISAFSSTTWADDKSAFYNSAQQAISKSGLTATSALELIQQDYRATPYEYELDRDDHRLYHEIKLVNGETKEKIEVKVDIETGQQQVRRSTLSKKDEGKQKIAAILHNEVSLIDAIQIANLNETALLLEAEFEIKDGFTYYEIEIYDGSQERELLVNPDTKTVIPTFEKK